MFKLIEAVWQALVAVLVSDQGYDFDLDFDLGFDEYDEAERKAAIASVGVPCGKPHVTPDGTFACGDEGPWCIDCQGEAAEVLLLLDHC